jgi:hypothetical protein
MKVHRIKFDSVHIIMNVVCAFRLLVSVRYRTEHQNIFGNSGGVHTVLNVHKLHVF